MKFLCEFSEIIRLFLVSFACVCSVLCVVLGLWILYDMFYGNFDTIFAVMEPIFYLIILTSFALSSFIVANILKRERK